MTRERGREKERQREGKPEWQLGTGKREKERLIAKGFIDRESVRHEIPVQEMRAK